MKTLQTAFMEAISGYTDHMHNSREWSHTDDLCLLFLAVVEVSSSFSNLVSEIRRLMIHGQPAERERGGGRPKLRDGNFDAFLGDPSCRKGK